MRKVLQKEGFQWTVAIAAAFFSVFSIATSRQYLITHRADSVLHLMLGFGLCLLYRWAAPHLAGRRGRFIMVGGLVYGGCYSLGEVLKASGRLSGVLQLLPGYWALFTAGFVLLFLLLDGRLAPGLMHKTGGEEKPQPGKAAAFFERLLAGNARATLLCWGIILVCWLPYLIAFFPGLVSADTHRQIQEGLGLVGMTTHHPPIHSLFIGGFMRLGKLLFGNFSAGVAMASLVQLLVQSLAGALALRYMQKLEIKLPLRVAALVWYALFMGYGWMAVTLWKDVWLAIVVFWFALFVIDIQRRGAAFFGSLPGVAGLVLTCFWMIMAKNTGVYIFLLTLVVMLVALKGCRRQLAALGLVCVVFWQLVTGPLYSALGIAKGDMREMLTLPLMQISLVVARAPDTVGEEDRALLQAVLPYDELAQRYDYRSSDAIKFEFNTAAFKENVGGYAMLWLRLGLSHPSLYVRAALETSFGYWYPDTLDGIFAVETYPMYLRTHEVDFDGAEPMAGKYAEPNRALMEYVQENGGMVKNIPGFAMLFSTGFYWWLALFCCLWLLYKRQGKRLLVFVPFAVVWLTCLVSPEYATFRYTYPFVLAAPFVVGYVFGMAGAGGGQADVKDKREAV